MSDEGKRPVLTGEAAAAYLETWFAGADAGIGLDATKVAANAIAAQSLLERRFVASRAQVPRGAAIDAVDPAVRVYAGKQCLHKERKNRQLPPVRPVGAPLAEVPLQRLVGDLGFGGHPRELLGAVGVFARESEPAAGVRVGGDRMATVARLDGVAVRTDRV